MVVGDFLLISARAIFFPSSTATNRIWVYEGTTIQIFSTNFSPLFLSSLQPFPIVVFFSFQRLLTSWNSLKKMPLPSLASLIPILLIAFLFRAYVSIRERNSVLQNVLTFLYVSLLSILSLHASYYLIQSSNLDRFSLHSDEPLSYCPLDVDIYRTPIWILVIDKSIRRESCQPSWIPSFNEREDK